MKDKFEEHACDMKNEAYCEEELEEDGLDFSDVEREHYNDEE